MPLKTLMGDHAITEQFKTRTDKLDFVECKGSAAPFFKRVVRNLEFDVAEMAIMTYLLAKVHGKPYRLLPFTVLARFQHPYLALQFCRLLLAFPVEFARFRLQSVVAIQAQYLTEDALAVIGRLAGELVGAVLLTISAGSDTQGETWGSLHGRQDNDASGGRGGTGRCRRD